MAKRRRKLSPEFEKLISLSKKDIELITAKIHDIDEEEIQDEYKTAFTPVLQEYMNLENSYKQIGFNSDVENVYKRYIKLLQVFSNEYEI